MDTEITGATTSPIGYAASRFMSKELTLNSVFNAHRDPFGFLSDLFKKDQKGHINEVTVSGTQASIAASMASTQSII